MPLISNCLLHSGIKCTFFHRCYKSNQLSDVESEKCNGPSKSKPKAKNELIHTADSDPSKTLGTQCHEKFLFCDDQSTHLTILVKKLDAPFCSK